MAVTLRMAALAAATCAVMALSAAPAGYGNIRNDSFWHAADSVPVYSQGGGIFRFADPQTGQQKYYWYGVRYTAAEEYRADPSVTVEGARFKSVTCYSSDNLTDWRFEGDVLTQAEVDSVTGGRRGWVGRLGVAYVKEINKYAMFVQCGVAGSDNAVLVAVADTPAGRFRGHDWFSMKSRIGTNNTGDQTVFTDPDTGKSYLVYSYGKGRNRIYLSEIGVNGGRVGLLDCRQIYRGAGREGNCMFKYKGKYYMCASDLYGWDSSHAYYLVADSIYGPYLPTNHMLVMDNCSADYAHVTQTGFFVTVRGTEQETVVYCGDRWADLAGNGLGYNQWVPLSFSGARPHFNSLSSWHLDAATGRWRVAYDNNYVRNGSFEADRRRVPNPVKPRQDWLSGWHTTVISGRKVSVDSPQSPYINHFNTRADRRFVVGEKSLNITDSTDFERVVCQTVSSTPYVPLPDGLYTLRAKVYVEGSTQRADMYAESGGRLRSVSMAAKGRGRWTEAVISGIRVSGGQAVVGFHVKGRAGAVCRVDDVSLVRE